MAIETEEKKNPASNGVLGYIGYLAGQAGLGAGKLTAGLVADAVYSGAANGGRFIAGGFLGAMGHNYYSDADNHPWIDKAREMWLPGTIAVFTGWNGLSHFNKAGRAALGWPLQRETKGEQQWMAPPQSYPTRSVLPQHYPPGAYPMYPAHGGLPRDYPPGNAYQPASAQYYEGLPQHGYFPEHQGYPTVTQQQQSGYKVQWTVTSTPPEGLERVKLAVVHGLYGALWTSASALVLYGGYRSVTQIDIPEGA